MIDKPADEWTAEDWKRLHAKAFEMSERLLDTIEAEGQPGVLFSPQVGGYGLLVAMGRLAGKHAYRGISLEEVWRLWTDDQAKQVFRRAFELERLKEH